jgi:hypothetical protein
MADIDIRRRTENRKGLPDALRAIQAAGGSIAVHWPIAKVLQTGDAGVGVPVLAELYEKMKGSPSAADLAELWSKLGVHAGPEGAKFDDKAPWAAVRHAIDGVSR